jgi:hypothetical protein
VAGLSATESRVLHELWSCLKLRALDIDTMRTANFPRVLNALGEKLQTRQAQCNTALAEPSQPTGLQRRSSARPFPPADLPRFALLSTPQVHTPGTAYSFPPVPRAGGQLTVKTWRWALLVVRLLA